MDNPSKDHIPPEPLVKPIIDNNSKSKNFDETGIQIKDRDYQK